MSTILLEPLDSSHAAELHELWSVREVVRFTNWELCTEPEQSAARVDQLRRRYAGDSKRLGPFVVRDGESRLVGLIGVDWIDGEHELWYLVRREFWGRGFGTAMVARMIEEAAGRGCERLVATAVDTNKASWRLLERHGFERQATLLHGFRKHGVRADLHRYGRAVQPRAAAGPPSVESQTLDRAVVVLTGFGPELSLPADERLARHFPELSPEQRRQVLAQLERVRHTVRSLAERGGESKLGRDALESELRAAHPFLLDAGLRQACFLVNYCAWHEGHDGNAAEQP